MQHDHSLLLDPAHDEDEVEDDVPVEEAQTVELDQVTELPDHVGGHTEDVVKQSVALEESADDTVPRYKESHCQEQFIREVQCCEAGVGDEALEDALLSVVVSEDAEILKIIES